MTCRKFGCSFSCFLSLATCADKLRHSTGSAPWFQWGRIPSATLRPKFADCFLAPSSIECRMALMCSESNPSSRALCRAFWVTSSTSANCFSDTPCRPTEKKVSRVCASKYVHGANPSPIPGSIRALCKTDVGPPSRSSDRT